MTKTVKWYCPECDILWNNLGYVLGACPKCSGTALEKVSAEVADIHDSDSVEQYIIDTLKQSDGYIVSDQVCWRCAGKEKRHYMIWPGRRDDSDYTKVTPLLQLPQCPIRVWEYADKSSFNITLDSFLRSLEVQDGRPE